MWYPASAGKFFAKADGTIQLTAFLNFSSRMVFEFDGDEKGIGLYAMSCLDVIWPV